jgi:two-component system chemotaxis response regulator CheB
VRVLVVEDSAVARRILTDTLSADKELEVVEPAADGKIALHRIMETHPDIVTLDVEMPVMNGLETLSKIREKFQTLPVIMYSRLTDRGTGTTLDALCRGASDYVLKPESETDLDGFRRHVQSELAPRIKALYAESRLWATPLPSPQKPKVTRRHRNRPPVDVLAIGASTGGPNALVSLLASLGQRTSLPILIVQHMPPMFTKLLAERLSRESPILVREAEDGVELEAGHAWLAPGQRHLIVKKTTTGAQLSLTHGVPENSCRPSVDVLFRSVAQVYGDRAIGVVLTGMGQDGLRGAQALKDAGSRVIAQDEKTSVIWGMPGSVARAGLADEVLPLGDIAPKIFLWAPEHETRGNNHDS